MDAVPPVVAVLCVVVSYAVGTTPTALVVGARRGVDPTRAGSGNPGASNVYRLAGRRAGAAVLAVDMVKGALPTLVGLLLGGRDLAVACGLAAVLGHVVPVGRGFRGGKGVATAAGVAVVAWPLASAMLAVVFVVIARLIGIASVGSLSVAVGLPLLLVLLGAPAWEVVASSTLALIVVVRHRENIRRLGRGEEHRVRPTPSTSPPTE